MDTYTGDLDVGGTTVTCTTLTAHYASGCALLKHYDTNNDGHISTGEVQAAISDYNAGIITPEEANFVVACWKLGEPNINAMCPGCYTPACTCTPWVDVECTAPGKIRQTRTCTPAGCDIEERIIDDPGCAHIGDITKVTLDDKLLPEDGTLGWLLNDEAAVKVYFKNTGNVANSFHIWVTDETGATLCDVTTAEVPADGVERYVACGSFTPSVKKVKTLTAHISP